MPASNAIPASTLPSEETDTLGPEGVKRARVEVELKRDGLKTLSQPSVHCGSELFKSLIENRFRNLTGLPSLVAGWNRQPLAVNSHHLS